MSIVEREALPAGTDGERAAPCVMVIFGAAGDLTKRKLVPALYNLAKQNLLSPEFAVIGIARAEMTSEAFREKISADIKEFATSAIDPAVWAWLERSLYYIPGEFGDPATYVKLQALLGEVDSAHG